MKLYKYFLILVFAATSCFGAPSFDWGTSGQVLQGFDGSFLLGNKTESITAFIQILYLGENKQYDGFIAAGEGVLGDDVVVATSWVGQNAVGSNVDGKFSPPTVNTDTVDTNHWYLVRVFDTASPNYGTGTVPSSGYYGTSQTFYGSVTTGPTQQADEFYISSVLQTLTPIPEPGTIALAFTAIGFFVIKRLRKKKDD